MHNISLISAFWTHPSSLFLWHSLAHFEIPYLYPLTPWERSINHQNLSSVISVSIYLSTHSSTFIYKYKKGSKGMRLQGSREIGCLLRSGLQVNLPIVLRCGSPCPWLTAELATCLIHFYKVKFRCLKATSLPVISLPVYNNPDVTWLFILQYMYLKFITVHFEHSMFLGVAIGRFADMPILFFCGISAKARIHAIA